MPPVIDIRPLKAKLRREIKEWRAELALPHKTAMDRQIYRRIVRLREYAECVAVLTYVSLPLEVDTMRLIRRAWADGKQVAVPRCVTGTREMEFYCIRSMEDLAPRSFGVLEPIPERSERMSAFAGTLCVVPALAYDLSGFRLGYGAGYYDRFLSSYPGVKVGVIYARNLRHALWHGRYDVPVDLLVTDKRLIPVKIQRAKTDKGTAAE